MISCANYYIIINYLEIGPCVQRIINVEMYGGRVEHIDGASFRIHCPSEKYQQHLYQRLEEAMDEDFPPDCEDCGNSHDEMREECEMGKGGAG